MAITEGKKYNLKDGKRLEIMAIKKGYVMQKYARCFPFVKSFKETDEFVKHNKRD